MKLNVAYNEQEVETMGVAKSKEFGFSDEAKEMMFMMFTKNIYSNPIGSVVREITSNCFDSHREAKVLDPVIIKLTNENNQQYISFIDVGIGMSPERMNKVYTRYFESTKRNDNNQIGGFGIGGKTPLAYGESFFLTTVFDGVKYTYSIRKGQKSPVLDLLDKTKTDAHNGTTIKIPIKGNDIWTFEKEITRQLYYFENVIFEGFSQNVKNDYRILEGKNFFYRGKGVFDYAHICLGRVAYPIDFNVLGNDDDEDDDFYAGAWNVPVALKLEIGDINVSASREAIEYTEATKKFLKKKLLAMKGELVAMLDKQHENLTSLEDYYRIQNDASSLILSKDDTINIAAFSKHKSVTIKKFSEINIPSSYEIISEFYDISMFGKKTRRDNTWDKSLKGLGSDKIYLVLESDNMTRKKNAYMKHTFKHFFTLRRSELSIGEVKTLIKKITPKTSTVVDTKIIFKQFRELQKDVYKLVEGQVLTYASVTVPDGFTVNAGKGYDPKQELPVTYDSKYGFDKERITMQTLAETKATLYYGDLEDQGVMSTYSSLYRSLFLPKEESKFKLYNYDSTAFPIRFIMVSKSNLRYITGFKNVKPFNQFISVLNRKKEAITKQIEKKLFEERYNRQSELFLNETLFNVIDKSFAKKVSDLKALRKKYDGVKTFNISTSKESTVVNLMNIAFDAITYKGHDLFAAVEKATEKNGMLSFVRIRKDFDPTDKNSDYSEKEISDILKLLKMAYVK